MPNLKKRETPIMVARTRVGRWFDGLSSKTLANLASQGRGPKVYRRGRLAFYRFDELEQYVAGEDEVAK